MEYSQYLDTSVDQIVVRSVVNGEEILTDA